MTLPHHRLIEAWSSNSAYRAALPAPDAVLALQERYAITLPPTFRAYILEAAPAEELWDDQDVTWWTPGRIRPISEEYAHSIANPEVRVAADRYLFFADWLIWCWAWAICCDPQDPNFGRVAVIDGYQDRFVSMDFTEFVEFARTDTSKLAASSNPP